MEDRSIRFLALALVVLLVAVVSFTVGAAGAPSGADSGDGDASIIRKMHDLGARLHQGGHPDSGHGPHDGAEFPHHMAAFLDSLGLSDEQRAHVDRVHDMLASGRGATDMMTTIHEELIGQLDAGAMDPRAIHDAIEAHLAETRTLAYSLSDEVVAFVSSLDESQRRMLRDHLGRLEARPDEFGH